MLRRWFVLALSALLALGLALGMAACGSVPASSSTASPTGSMSYPPEAPDSSAIELGPVPTASIEYDLPSMTIENWTQSSDLIVAGTVVKVDSPRWNSDDGRPWTPRGEDAPMPIVYQTFYVHPEQVLKGEPQWGAPVAFRAWWNTSSGAGPLAVGDMVVAFGLPHPERYGGGVYEPADAYWLTSDANSLWVRQDGAETYANCGIVRDQAERQLTLDGLKALIREGGGPTTLAMWSPARESMELGWGETAWIEGVLQVTATAPQRDPSARPVESAADDFVFYCTVTITNIGSHPRSYDQSWLMLATQDESWGGGGDGLKTSITPALGSGTLGPGETVTGAVAFQFSTEEVTAIRTLRFDTGRSARRSGRWCSLSGANRSSSQPCEVQRDPGSYQ